MSISTRALVLLITFSVFVVAGCNNKPAGQQIGSVVSGNVDTLNKQFNTMVDSDYIPEDENATMYLVVADSGSDYWKLEHFMFQLHDKTGLAIDTLGKLYNMAKMQITLPEDDEDELWRGEYYPRRYGEDFLSLEQLSFYDTAADEKTNKTMILVAGLFDSAQRADSLASAIKSNAPAVYVKQTTIYMGCMH